MNPSTDAIPFHRPFIGREEEEAVLRVLRSGWLTTAGETRAFESEFAEAVGAKHAVAVNSATAGLHLALEALGVSAGGKVITTPYTFTSTAEVVRYLGADPVFVDIRAGDLNIDPAGVAAALERESNVKAILPVHIGGHPCAMEDLCALSRTTGVPLLEDAAHAFPAIHAGRALGTWGHAGVYSFYATKTITTGEGGMIVTDDDRLARRMSVMRLHGIDREVWDRYTSTRPAWHYEVVDAGYKYNLPDLLAAIGRVQLRRANDFLAARRAIATRYHDALAGVDYIELPPPSDGSSWHLYVVRIVPGRIRISRDEFIERLSEDGIGTSVHYIPLHVMPYYRDRYGLKPEDFPVSWDSYSRAISLPIYPGLTISEVDRIAETVRRIGDAARL